MAAAATLLFSSCLTLSGLKKPMVLVDAPNNTNVDFNGEDVIVEDVTAFRDEHTQGNTNHVTLYKYPGVKVKLKKASDFTFKSGNKQGTFSVKTHPAIGLLIVEGIFTAGIGTIIDLATGAFWVTNNRFIDVDASLNHKTPRSNKDLKRYVRNSFN